MDVSLWGPASLLTSTLGPTTVVFEATALRGLKLGEETTWNFAHQVGLEFPESLFACT